MAPLPEGDAGACAAHELKHVIAALISQISEADRRQSDAIGAMQARLAELGADARNVQKRVPAEFADAFGRLEDALAGLAVRLGEVAVRHSEDVPRPLFDSPATGPVPSAIAAEAATHADVDTEAVPGAGGADVENAGRAEVGPPALRSAIPGEAGEARVRHHAEPRRDRPAQDPFEFAGYSVEGDPENPWSEQDAEALTQAYEDATGDVAVRTPATPSRAVGDAPATSAAAPVPATSDTAVAAASRALAGDDRAWLEARFAHIAAHVDEQLGRIDPEAALADLGRRFDVMENRFTTALQDVATRADVEGIRIVEACLNDLCEQIDRTQGEVARFGTLEAEVVALAARLSDERLAALAAPQPAAEIDIVGLAESISAHLEMRERNLAPPQVVVDDSRFMSGVADLKDVVERLVEAQRSGDEQTSSMLDTMQQALIRLLDRMETLEAAHEALGEERVAAEAVPVPVAPPRQPVAEPERRAAPPAMTIGATALDQSVGDAGVAPARTPAEPPLTSGQAAIARIEAGLMSSSAEPLARHQAPAEPAPQQGRDRQQFIEAARRAAQAASERHQQQAAPAAPQQRAGNPIAAMRRQMVGGAAAAPQESAHEAAARAHAEAQRKAYALPGLEAAAGRGVHAGRDGGTGATAGKGRRFSLPGLGGASAAKGSPSRVRLLAAVLVAVVIGFGGFKLLAGRKPVVLEPQKVERQLVTPETMAREKAGEGSEETTREGTGSTDPVQPGRTAAPEGLPAPAPAMPRRIGNDGTTIGAPAPTAISAPIGEGDVETPFSLGIEVDRGGPQPTAAELKRNRMQQNFARWSTHVGASQPPIVGMPAALTPAMPRGGGAPAMGDQAARHVPQTTALPPTSVGPLSLRMAAANGDPSAEFAVGARLAEGKAGQQDFKQAIVWYQRAASRGFALAQYRLATLHERGLGARADAGRARIWYLRAAEQGNVKAMHNLAVLAAGPASGQPDYATAASWFGEAAERGLADSQFNLAILYESGLGVTADRKAAYKWFSLASRSGDGEAGKRLAALARKMSAEEKALADAEAREWRAKPVIALANDPFIAGEAWKNRQGQQARATGG
ncbi:MAG: tetratricopeptide repeat protein [Hyphomicrobiaceae bacterium]